MKKVIKILITLLIILAAAGTGLYIWQYENISALMDSRNSSSEDLAVKMDEHRNKLKTDVEKYVSKPIEDISAEDEEKLLKGEISLNEVAEKYNLPKDYIEEKKPEINKPPQNEIPQQSETSAESIETVVSDSVSKMNALKVKYINKLGELERQIYKEYTSLPEDKQNEDSIFKILMNNIDYVADLEKKCDDEVAAVLSNLESELIKYGGDEEIVQMLQDSYKEEKRVKKAYYISLYSE